MGLFGFGAPAAGGAAFPFGLLGGSWWIWIVLFFLFFGRGFKFGALFNYWWVFLLLLFFLPRFGFKRPC